MLSTSVRCAKEHERRGDLVAELENTSSGGGFVKLLHPVTLIVPIFVEVSLIIHEPCMVSDIHSWEVAAFHARFGQ